MYARTATFAALIPLIALIAAPKTGADDKKPAAKVELKVGDLAPTFEAPSDQGTSWNSADHVGKKWVVVYFYPGDFTPGCTAQANAFRDAMNRLTVVGVEVIGISGDSVASHAMFKKAQKLNFTILSDEEGTVAGKFGVPVGPGGTAKTKGEDGKPIEIKRAATLARWTFIIGKDGKVAYINTKVTPAKDAEKILEVIDGSNVKPR